MHFLTDLTINNIEVLEKYFKDSQRIKLILLLQIKLNTWCVFKKTSILQNAQEKNSNIEEIKEKDYQFQYQLMRNILEANFINLNFKYISYIFYVGQVSFLIRISFF